MFAKLAYFGHFGRTHGTRFAAWSSNDNHPLRLVVASRLPKRRALACHWHTTPSGTLECVWTVEGTDTPGTAAPEPQICRLNGSPQRALLAA
jgi:hypothetical protein